MDSEGYENVALLGIYFCVFCVGAWATWKSHRRLTANGNDLILGNRSFGAFVSIVGMTATWASGTYIAGTVQAVHDKGFAWSQSTIGYPLSLAIGGWLFGKKMREDGYVTLMDPFQEHFGAWFGGFLSLIPITGELLWSASLLATLGNMSQEFIGLDGQTAIIFCATATVAYTFLGGIYSISFADVTLLILIYFGMWLSLPFVLNNPNVSKLDLGNVNWTGHIHTYQICYYVDCLLLYTFGTVSWQSFYQRILTIRNPNHAKMVSYTAAILCFIAAVPAVLIGIIGKALDADGIIPQHLNSSNNSEITIAKVLRNNTPPAVSFLGYCSVSSAVMSATSAGLLSASSLISRNIYKNIFRKEATMLETSAIMRLAIAVIGIGATAMAILVPYISILWYISAVILYVVIMPQLLCIMYFQKHVNRCGSLFSSIIGIIMVILGGEAKLGIPVLLRYPFYDPELSLQLFPLKTIAMLVSLIILLIVSNFRTCPFKLPMPSKFCPPCFGLRKNYHADSNDANPNADLDVGENNSGVNRQPSVEVINPAITENEEMFELKDKKLAKLNLIKSEVYYGSHGETTDV